MYKYMREHEAYIKSLLISGEPQEWEQIKEYHVTQIEFMQHERLIHLIITLVFGVFLLGTFIAVIIINDILLIYLCLILLILEMFYIVHYFRLENGVQRWYSLHNQIIDKNKIVK